jgi:hypothetical protein
MMTTWQKGWAVTLAAGVLANPLPSAAAGPDAKAVQPVIDKAVAFLKTRPKADGRFSPELGGPGVSALVVAALLRNGVSASDPLVANTLAAIEKSVKDNGGIYDKGLANYTTSVAVMALAEANTNGKYNAIIQNASKFLKSIQNESAIEDPEHGGVGYDGKTRPDASNTAFFLDALLAAGVAKDDPAVQRALKFMSRCQNLPGETNDQEFAKKTTDDDKGGLVYVPKVGDPKKDPNVTPDGGLRSVGAMTYAGLKSFLYAGVSKDDQRVKGAVDWIRRHYSLEENYPRGKAGLFYYYHTFGKAMAALGEDTFTDAKGVKHDWRKDLFEALKKQQKADGSWANENPSFGEGNPDLATAFALLTLSYCQQGKK